MRIEVKIEYLMFDGTIKGELKSEDQINCKGILTHHYFDTIEEAMEFEKKFEKAKEKRDNFLIKQISTWNKPIE